MAMSIRGAERSEGIARRAEQAVQRCTAERRKPFGGNLAECDPIVLGAKPNLFKLFSNDVGLLAAQYMNGIQLDILNGVKSIIRRDMANWTLSLSKAGRLFPWK